MNKWLVCLSHQLPTGDGLHACPWMISCNYSDPRCWVPFWSWYDDKQLPDIATGLLPIPFPGWVSPIRMPRGLQHLDTMQRGSHALHIIQKIVQYKRNPAHAWCWWCSPTTFLIEWDMTAGIDINSGRGSHVEKYKKISLTTLYRNISPTHSIRGYNWLYWDRLQTFGTFLARRTSSDYK